MNSPRIHSCVRRLLVIGLLGLPIGIMDASTLLRYPLEHPTTVRYYYDHDPVTGGLRDYAGNVGANAKTKDSPKGGHKGTDYPLAKGLPVVAAADGVVLSSIDRGVVDNLKDDCGVSTEYSRSDCVNDNGGAGNAIKIRHADGTISVYMHLKKGILVGFDEPVVCGQKIAEVGSSGDSSGYHLHFELRTSADALSNNRFDPYAGPGNPGRASVWTDQGPYGGVPGSTCGGGASDMTNPTVSINSPCSSSCTVSASEITVSGNATDSGGSGLSHVFVLNGANSSFGYDYGPSGSSSSWSVDGIELQQGVNTIYAQATDGGDNFSTAKSISVTYQPGGGTCSYTINPASKTRDGDSGYGYIKVESNPVDCTAGSWSAASNTPWLTLTGPDSGSGGGTWKARFEYPENPSESSSRQATVTFQGTSPSTFTLMQEAGCHDPAPPVLQAPTVSANGSNYVVTWTDTSPEVYSEFNGYFEFDEATDASFAPEKIIAGSRGYIETTRTTAHSPSLRTTYYTRARARHKCAGVEYWSDFSNVGSTTVAGKPPGPPVNLVAEAISPTAVRLSWLPGSYASAYEIRRRGNFAHIATTASTTWTDAGLTPGNAYVYDVRTIGNDGEARSTYSNPDLAITIVFTDDPVIAGTTVQLLHVNELRRAVNAVRSAAGLTTATFDDQAWYGASVMASQIEELRAALNPARTALGLPVVSYSALAPGATTIRALHLTELRSGVR